MTVEQAKRPGALRVWGAPIALAAVASSCLTIASLPAPRAGEVTAIVILDQDARTTLASLLELDPGLEIVDQRWAGRALFVVFARADLPSLLRRKHLLLMFDFNAAGCRI